MRTCHIRYGRGWVGILNGALLKLAEDAGFQVMITADRSIIYQQNRTGRVLALVVLSTNQARLVLTNSQRIVEAVNASAPGKLYIPGHRTLPILPVIPLWIDAYRFRSDEPKSCSDDRTRTNGLKVCVLGRPPGRGYSCEAPVIIDVPTQVWLFRDEIFGPVMPITTFDDADRAIAQANSTRYGLSAYVWTKIFIWRSGLPSALSSGWWA